MNDQVEAAGPGAASNRGAALTAFEGQILEHRTSLGRLAAHLCRNRIDADDLVQEVMMKALLYRHQFTPGSNLKAWLNTILRNTHALRCRRRGRETHWDPESVAERLPTMCDPTIPMELDDVRRALTLLPPRCRDVLVLAAGGSAYDEMAFILGCPIGTVKSRLSRARDLLQAVLAEGAFKDLEPCADPAELVLLQFAAMTR
jgi:RNA polymerase sigma-70 factor (ECF subfamily)